MGWVLACVCKYKIAKFLHFSYFFSLQREQRQFKTKYNNNIFII